MVTLSRSKAVDVKVALSLLIGHFRPYFKKSNLPVTDAISDAIFGSTNRLSSTSKYNLPFEPFKQHSSINLIFIFS